VPVIDVVVISTAARKDLRKCPSQIVRKFMLWVASVQTVGLEATRLTKGFHDEPLSGEWQGYRSIRLNRSYRAFCKIASDGSVELALVENVNKHKY
jgi:proteic killer suppression protein